MEKQLETVPIQTNEKTFNILRQNIIDHVVMNTLNSDFKNRQDNQLELSLDEKQKNIENTLNDGHLNFLYLFGEYLLEEHLEYFRLKNDNNYEINFHLHRLTRLLNSKKVNCKNRRYQAMLELLKGDYFSDNEMRNREPLLWEQLVGQFLSDEEKFNFDNQYLTQNSLTEVLFEQIDRDKRDNLKRKQQIDEINGSDEENDNELLNEVVNTKPSSLWGEYSKPKNQTMKIGKRRWKENYFLNHEQCNNKKLNENEKILLLNEFKSHMIEKFLNGQEDFNYNDVDDNPEFDNLHIKSIDEEEKYFDSESPVEEIPIIENETEDELDVYINMLEKSETTNNIVDKFKKL